MIWSFSDSRTFRKCQRQWSFRTLAQWNAKDTARRELHILKQLQTVSAWRGTIVDQVISGVLVPAWNKKRPCSLDDARAAARRLFDKQLQFALTQGYREPGMSQTKAGDAFAALLDIEDGRGISREVLDQAWSEIVQALTNLYEMRPLFNSFSKSRYMIAQRALTFDIAGVRVRAVPDLIVFFEDVGLRPLIVDWKVHAQGVRDYRLQLAVYALALTRCNEHNDFQLQLDWEPTAIRLIEAQLLTRRLRAYRLTDEDLINVENYIAETATEMRFACGEDARATLDPFDFPATRYPEACTTCPFHTPCWENNAA